MDNVQLAGIAPQSARLAPHGVPEMTEWRALLCPSFTDPSVQQEHKRSHVHDPGAKKQVKSSKGCVSFNSVCSTQGKHSTLLTDSHH